MNLYDLAMQRVGFARKIILSCVALSVVATLGDAWQGVSHGDTLLFDNFDDGIWDDDNPGTWIPVFGPQLDASSGDLRISQTGRNGGALWEQPIDGDVSIRTRARVVAGNFGIATKFGGGNGNDGYYFALEADQLYFLARVDRREYPLEGAVTVLQAVDEDIFLQLDVIGNRVAGWYWTESSGPPQAPQLQATLTAHPLIDGGRAGFYVDNESLLRYARIANSAIPVPEPCALWLIVSVLIVSGFGGTRGSTRPTR